MASADYSVGTKVTADVSNFEKGMNKAEKSLKGFSDKLANSIDRLGKKGLVGSVANVTLAMQGLTKSFSTVIKFTKDVGKAINECTEAYKGQVIAERALDTAIQNNPFITGASSKALKQFASDMQRVSNYGDEELIPMMTNLVSLGRTEAETMQIMSVAMDMSAGMGISLDTAITQLNATLNGNIGRLGQQNAELKGLTEEELKQGKAVEILGEKFKGLSSATADTSKQLQNIKGDFKEALGQFTLPSSDMWNKFWAGFYQRGIEVINKINSYLDAQTIGKKLSGAITDQLKVFGAGDIGGRIDYIRNTLKVVTDEELLALQNYLEGLAYISSDQEQILRRIKAETDARKQAVIDQKAQAEASARQKREEEEKLAKQKELEEQEKKSAEERAKALKLQSEWEDKLFAIRLENLEATRDKELENENLTQEEREAIVDFYGEQILAMKIKQLEKEREEALKQENLTEEAKRSINLYYENRITNAKKDEEEKRLKLKKKTSEKEVKDEKNKFAEMLKVAGEYTKKLAETLKNVTKKIASTVKSVISSVGNIFTKLFEFKPDEALDNLLKFEDAVLTFFVETLPKLPSFFASAFQSVAVLIQTIFNIIDFDNIANIIGTIEKGLFDLITTIAKSINGNANRLTKGFVQIVKTIIEGLANWISSGGWKEVLNAVLTIQRAVEQVITDNIDELVDTIISMLPDLVNTLIDSIVSASKTLSKLIKPILKLVVKLVEAIIEVAFSDEVLDASMEVITSFIEAVIDVIINMLPKILPKLIAKIIKFMVSSFPKLVVAIVKGLVQAFTKVNWGEVVKDIFMGFIDAFKELFGIHSPSKLFESFGVFMVEGLVNGLKGIAGAVAEILTPLFDLIDSLFESVVHSIDFSIDTSFDGLLKTLTSINDVVVTLTEVSFKGLNTVIESSGNAFAKITDSVANLVKQLTNLIEKVNQAGSALGLGGGSSSSGGGISFTPSLPIPPLSDPLGLGKIKEAVSEVIDEAKSGGGYGKHSTGSTAGDVAVDLLVPGGFLRHFFADGSQNVNRGLALVGEAGPELIRFNGGEQVLNNRNTNKALANVGKANNTFNVTFNNLQDTTAFAMMSQLKAYNRQMAINGIM